MVILDEERRIARAIWQVAAGMVEHRDATARDLARAAIERPCAETIRALVEAGRDADWLPSVMDALVQVGIAGAEDVLGNGSDMPDEIADAVEREVGGE